jgi:hypothetical protein
VVQVIVAVVPEIPETLTAEITGADGAVVVKVKFPEVPMVPEEFADLAA